jgi:putative pyruvate formate lyase activating enzyme
MGEENCLRGTRGSGTIFFTRCNLHCVFCQNDDISQSMPGQEVSAAQIADAMLALQDKGCHNINFVTPSHVVPQIIEAIALAADQGLRVPIVYNTGGYDRVETIRRLDGLVDIYMPDFKFWSNASGRRYLHAADYSARAREAITEMHRQVGDLCFTPDGLACRGLLIRHLVMPGLLQESQAIFQWLADELSPDTFINIMAQYRPAHRVGAARKTEEGVSAASYDEINRRPTTNEILNAYELASRAGLWRFDR